MCGICGIIRFDNKVVQEAPIYRMMKTMKHRGPDDEGIFIENDIGLGFVRLSIIDLTNGGHQPKLSDDERFVVVFNGEIYNYIELREELIADGVNFTSNTDTEVLLNSYIKWGEDCLNRFNGMWAFAIYDRTDRSLFVARDRFGIKPFYYLLTKESFAFCSEIKPLLTLIPGKPTQDSQTIFDFLVFSRTDQTDRTFFNEIKKLQHGHKFRLELNSENFFEALPSEKWYDLKERVLETDGFKDPAEYKSLFTSAIGLHLRSDVPVGVCLSGGLDSSSIVSVLLNEYNKTDLHTFSAVYKKGQSGDETEFIDEYSSRLKKMYYTSPDAESLKRDLGLFIRAHEEPIPTTSPYAQFEVMRLAQGKVVVTLDGQGADEELAGYHYFFGFYFKELLLSGRIGKLFRELYFYVTKHKSLMGVKSILFFILPKRLRTQVRVKEKGYLVKDFIKKFKESNSIAGNLYGSKDLISASLDHFEYKLEHLLKWEDRNSMWFSLESRVPFLDYRLVEKTLATSIDWKIRKGMTKYILREAMDGILPEKIRARRDKMGFGTPEDEWFRTSIWQDIIEEILCSKSFQERNIVDINIAKERYKRHLEGKVNCGSEIWKWVHLELWFREFID